MLPTQQIVIDVDIRLFLSCAFPGTPNESTYNKKQRTRWLPRRLFCIHLSQCQGVQRWKWLNIRQKMKMIAPAQEDSGGVK